MKLLVVGGAGYIGSHFVKAALDAGHEVAVADNLSTGHRASVDERALFAQLDVRDQAATCDLLEQSTTDAVVNFAAFSIASESMQEPLKYFDNNVGGMVSLLAAMRSVVLGGVCPASARSARSALAASCSRCLAPLPAWG